MFPILPNSFLSSNTLNTTIENSNKKQYKNNTRTNNEKCITSEKFKFDNNISLEGFNNKQLQQTCTSDIKVFAAEFLKKDSKSVEISSEELLLPNITVKKLNISLSKDGFLKPLEKTSANWFKNVKLSSDVHSNNSLIEITASGLIQIRILKDILPEQEITCWFSENILAYMAVPFLVPVNIRGNNCYTCHICSVSYESPNPLKIHLALLCDQQNIDILWIRLHHSLQKLFLSTNHDTVSSSVILSSPLLLSSSLPHSSSSPRLSAFRPVTSSTITTIDSLSSSSSSPSTFLTSSHPQYLHHHHHHHHEQSISQSTSSPISLVSAAAQIETIVSNMGSSKQGHLCIYCGKIYSRKYGLKIHIRTHTGFKPLKCKFCYRPFGDPSNLNKHVRLHLQSSTKHAIYKCHLCLKVMGRKRDLQRHMQTRHSEMFKTIITNNDTIMKGESNSSEGD